MLQHRLGQARVADPVHVPVPLCLQLNRDMCCPVLARPCSCFGPYVPLAREVAVFGSCRSVPAWCVVCGVHPTAPPPRLCWRTFACLHGHPDMRGCSAYGPGPILTRRACLRLILFCTCPPLCAGVLWPMPAWVWLFLSFWWQSWSLTTIPLRPGAS